MVMNREMVFVGLLLVLLGFGFAYTIGQTVTQQQLNNADIENFGFNAEQVSAVKDFNNSTYVVTFKYDMLKPLDSGDYEIFEHFYIVKYPFSRYNDCRSTLDVNGIEQTRQYCVQKVKKELITKAITRRELLRDRLLSWQEKSSFIDELDVSMDYNELN